MEAFGRIDILTIQKNIRYLLTRSYDLVKTLLGGRIDGE